MTSEFRLTGKHVLAALLGFFLVILSVNLIFINFAVKTFPGEKEKKSYLQGLNYNERLAARESQNELGWTVKIDGASLLDNHVEITLSFVDAAGAPITGLDVTAVLSRPMSASEDYAIAFLPGANGEYVGKAPAGEGVWNLDGRAINNASDEFEFVNRVILQ